MATGKDTRPILVPVDFSPHSDAAFVSAMEMAEMMGSPLTVLHVVHDLAEAPGYYDVKGGKKQMGRLEDVATNMLNAFMQKMQKKYSKRTVLKKATPMLVVGLPVNRILEMAAKINARMIVMGSQGRTGLPRLMLGAKTEQVVRLSPISVLVVKTKKDELQEDGEK